MHLGLELCLKCFVFLFGIMCLQQETNLPVHPRHVVREGHYVFVVVMSLICEDIVQNERGVCFYV